MILQHYEVGQITRPSPMARIQNGADAIDFRPRDRLVLLRSVDQTANQSELLIRRVEPTCLHYRQASQALPNRAGPWCCISQKRPAHLWECSFSIPLVTMEKKKRKKNKGSVGHRRFRLGPWIIFGGFGLSYSKLERTLDYGHNSLEEIWMLAEW